MNLTLAEFIELFCCIFQLMLSDMSNTKMSPIRILDFERKLIVTEFPRDLEFSRPLTFLNLLFLQV